MNEKQENITFQYITEKIIVLNNKRVMLDRDLAELYGVSTKRLNEQVKRNIDRFPSDFMFQLTLQEVRLLRSHFATSKKRQGGRTYLPYVFTQEGVAMLSSVLNSKKAITVNVFIMQAFVKLREIMFENKNISERINKLESRVAHQGTTLKQIITYIDTLHEVENKPRKKIGFH
ncbi:MAG: ORF6N domain-containing protein [Candidatus Omnitrophica bacterium]|nr:ORF6N domain-containing protein [Candidatus Omnitrophota bacterium]